MKIKGSPLEFYDERVKGNAWMLDVEKADECMLIVKWFKSITKAITNLIKGHIPLK